MLPQTFAEQLPEEIFLEITSYLSQIDRIHIAQVNQGWRALLHSHPEIWTTLFIDISGLDVDGGYVTDKLFESQMAFYTERIPEDGPFSIKNLSLHFKQTLQNRNVQLMGVIELFHLHRCEYSIADLEAISISNFTSSAGIHFLKALEKKFSNTLRAIRFNAIDDSELVSSIIQARLLFPRLEVLEGYTDCKSARSDSMWPYLGKSIPLGSSNAKLKRLVNPGSWDTQALLEPELMAKALTSTGIDILPASLFEDLEHISLAFSLTASLFLSSGSLNKLRNVCLDGVLLAVAIRCDLELQAAGYFTREDRARMLDIELSLPSLHDLRLTCSKAGLGGSQARLVTRPSLTLCRLNAPSLQYLCIENYAGLHGSASTRDLHEQDKKAFDTFAKRHTNLRTLKLIQTNCPELEACLGDFPNLERLHLSHAESSATFIHSATSPALPQLRHLAIPFCTNINNSDLLRLVRSKGRQLRSLDIEGCKEMQKEAVDWLRKSVAEVIFNGWRRRDQQKTFELR